MTDKSNKSVKLRMSKRRSAIKLILLILFISIVGYYGITILAARFTTEKTAERYLAHIVIRKQDLSAEQISVLLKIQDPGFYDIWELISGQRETAGQL